MKERNAVARIHQLLNTPGLLRASLVLTQRSCGRDYCRCRLSKRHRHACWYLTQRHQGRSRMKFVPQNRQGEVQAWIGRYQEIKRLLDVVSNVYWEALKKRP